MPQLKIYLFGPPRVEFNGELLEITLRKALALIAYLAVTGKPASREAIASMLWPESAAKTARASLRRLLYSINQLGEGSLLEVTPSELALNQAIGLWVDVGEFQSLITQDEATED